MEPEQVPCTAACGASFDPEHAVLERDPDQLQQFIDMLEEALGDRARVVSVLEIGSYAKGEAVPASDTDTRVYVTSPTAYLFNGAGRSEQPLEEEFAAQYGALPCRDYAWDTFNGPVSGWISERLGSTIEFGFADRRTTSFELGHLDRRPSFEHALLFQSNVLYDADGFVREQRQRLRGQIYPPLVASYRKGLQDRVSKRMYSFLGPHPWDEDKLERGGQIQWVQQAVRCLRDAVATVTYAATGTFLYRKAEVLDFYRRHLPDDLAFVQQLYTWKTDPTVRADMVRAFRRDRATYDTRFRALMPQLAGVVARVSDLAADVPPRPTLRSFCL